MIWCFSFGENKYQLETLAPGPKMSFAEAVPPVCQLKFSLSPDCYFILLLFYIYIYIYIWKYPWIVYEWSTLGAEIFVRGSLCTKFHTTKLKRQMHHFFSSFSCPFLLCFSFSGLCHTPNMGFFPDFWHLACHDSLDGGGWAGTYGRHDPDRSR